MQFASRLLLTSALLLVAQSAQAGLYTSTLNNVDVGGTTYTFTFSQFDGGYDANSFDAFYGSTGIPSFEFTNSTDASSAVSAILAALAITPVDVTPAPDGTLAGFRIYFSATATDASFVTGFLGSVNGPFTFPRTQGNNFSVATFTPFTTGVPEPSTIVAFGLGLAGLVVARRRR